nr:ribonuclease H-like domain-containing protein [Tanacetum cinerariifolium]
MFSFPSTKSTTTPSYDFLDDSTDLISTIIHTALITPVSAPVHTSQVNVPTPPTPPTPPLPPTPQSVPQIIPEHAPAPTNDSPTVSIHPMVTRSCVETTRPNHRYVGHVSTISPLPRSYKEAFNDLNWRNTMLDEYNALIKNKTWTSVPRPEGANIVHCMWLFRHKFLADGTLSRYNARLVANGSTHVEGVDVDETFSLVKPGTIRTVLSFAISRHWHLAPGFSSLLLTLLLLDLLLVVVNPLYLFTNRIIASLHREFSITDLGALNYFLGISVTRDSSGMFLSQRKYAMEILERAHMVGCNPSQTPVDTESKLGDGGNPVVDPTLYRSLAGSLQLLTFTRPNITYAMQHVCLYMHDPQEPHFSALKRILWNVQGTLDYGLQLFSSTTDSLIAYSDVDWACCPTTRRSTSGAEAEYHGVANAVAETCWIRNLLRALHTLLSSVTIVYYDNEKHGFLGMLGNIDCTKWPWAQWKVGLRCQLWLNNDINVIRQLFLSNVLNEGKALEVPYVDNALTIDEDTILLTGYIHNGFFLLKSILQSDSYYTKRIRYKQVHEAAGKDVKRVFVTYAVALRVVGLLLIYERENLVDNDVAA